MASKKYKLRFRAVNRDIFEAVKNGIKKVETRAATIKFRNIKAGDAVVLLCGKQKFEKRVKNARHFKSIESLLGRYRLNDIDPRVASVKELKKVYHGFPNYRAKIKKYGIIALELK